MVDTSTVFRLAQQLRAVESEKMRRRDRQSAQQGAGLQQAFQTLQRQQEGEQAAQQAQASNALRAQLGVQRQANADRTFNESQRQFDTRRQDVFRRGVADEQKGRALRFLETQRTKAADAAQQAEIRRLLTPSAIQPVQPTNFLRVPGGTGGQLPPGAQQNTGGTFPGLETAQGLSAIDLKRVSDLRGDGAAPAGITPFQRESVRQADERLGLERSRQEASTAKATAKAERLEDTRAAAQELARILGVPPAIAGGLSTPAQVTSVARSMEIDPTIEEQALKASILTTARKLAEANSKVSFEGLDEPVIRRTKALETQMAEYMKEWDALQQRKAASGVGRPAPTPAPVVPPGDQGALPGPASPTAQAPVAPGGTLTDQQFQAKRAEILGRQADADAAEKRLDDLLGEGR